MKVEFNLPGITLDHGATPTVAAGSVVDHLAAKVAWWVKSALKKTKVEDLTEEEMIGLAVMAGCAMRTVIVGESSYRLEATHPISVALVEGEWRVYEAAHITAGDDA